MTRLNPLLRISAHFDETLKTHEPSLSKQQRRRRALDALGSVGIPPTRYDHYPHEFSGGMRQRIMIALVLVLNPAMVVADEPTTALDVLVEAQILRILADIKANYDTSVLLITHNLGIVAEACDRVAVMYAGKIVEQGDGARGLPGPAAPVHRRAAALDDLALDRRAALDPGCTTGSRRSATRVAGSTRAARARWRSVPRSCRSRSARRSGTRLPAGSAARRSSSRWAAQQPLNGRRLRMPTKPDVLDVRDLKVHFPLRGGVFHRLSGRDAGAVKAVDGVSFTLAPGEVLGVVGRVRLWQDHAGSRDRRHGAGHQRQHVLRGA